MTLIPSSSPEAALLLVSTKNLAGSDFLSMRTEFVSYPQSIRFVRLDSEYAYSDGKYVNHRLQVLDFCVGPSQTFDPEVAILGAAQEEKTVWTQWCKGPQRKNAAGLRRSAKDLIRQGWYYVESLTGQRHDRFETESQELQPWTAVSTLLGLSEASPHAGKQYTCIDTRRTNKSNVVQRSTVVLSTTTLVITVVKNGKNQYGFRKYHSTAYALACLICMTKSIL